MSRLVTRRKVITTALTALGGASGLAVAAGSYSGAIAQPHPSIYVGLFLR